MSNKVKKTGNQQATYLKNRWGASETTRRAPLKKEALQAYLQGALHDGTFSSNKRFRFSQKGIEWPFVLKDCFSRLGYTSWIYREGKKRNVFVLETLADFLDFDFRPDKLRNKISHIAYIRGFFDAEGGVPHNPNDRFYIQLVQKNKKKLKMLKKLLDRLDIKTGTIHNPSKRVDPEYWRMYVAKDSYGKFIRTIGSWHPKKQSILIQRMKI